MKAVLTYHSIDDSGSPISVSPRAFAEHAAWLASGRVRVLSLDGLAAHPDRGEDALAITFDDAFENASGAVERLCRDGLPVTIFTPTAHVGRTNEWGGRRDAGIPVFPLMNWDELGRLSALGASIEAHTRTHPRLTRLTGMLLDEELQGSRADLDAQLGVTSRHFAYPYGDVDAAVAERTRRCYAFAYTTRFRGVRARDDHARLPRLDMYYFREPGRLESCGTSAFSRYVAWCRVRRRARSLVVR